MRLIPDEVALLNRPVIDNAPGLTWKQRKVGWEALWAADKAVLRRGYPVKDVSLWKGFYPNEETCGFIAKRCRELQQWMHDWMAAHKKTPEKFDGVTLHSLIWAYKTDPVSNYQSLPTLATRRIKRSTTTNRANMDIDHSDKVPAYIREIPAGTPCVAMGTHYSVTGWYDGKGHCVFIADPQHFRPDGISKVESPRPRS